MRRVVSALALMVVLSGAATAHAYRVPVLVPDHVSMQYASFWVAFGGGFFADEGYDVDVVVPPTPADAQLFWEQRRIDVAVLPATAFTSILATHGELALIANLFANDPINLVVRRSVIAQTQARVAAPIHDRLNAVRGVSIGLATHSAGRFGALYDVFGLDDQRDARMTFIEAGEQCAAFHERRVDALYAESPCLEHAIVHDDAVVLVNQSAGEVAPVSKHVIVAFAARPSLLEMQRPVAIGLLRAMLRAARLIHDTPQEAVAILARQFPEKDPRELEVIVAIYAPAIPVAPEFPPFEIPRSAMLYSEAPAVPDFAHIDLSHAVNYDVMGQAEEHVAPNHARNVMLSAAAILAIMTALGVVTRRSRSSTRRYKGPTST